MGGKRGEHFVGVIGSGSSGTVEEYILDGKKVAVKRWNGDSEVGRRELENEVRVYQFLAEARAKVLGKGIPIVHWSKCTADDLVIITEYVGSSIAVVPGGAVIVGEDDKMEILTISDMVEVLKAAKCSLQMLHDCGVSHGDARWYNLRVEKLREPNSNHSKWKAWWVDLGRASICAETHDGKDEDMANCEALFADEDMGDSEGKSFLPVTKTLLLD